MILILHNVCINIKTTYMYSYNDSVWLILHVFPRSVVSRQVIVFVCCNCIWARPFVDDAFRIQCIHKYKDNVHVQL